MARYTSSCSSPSSKRQKCNHERRKQHLYLALDDWKGGYSIRKIDADEIMDDDGDDEAAAAALLITEDPPSECLRLKNVFDGHVEKWPEFYLDVKDCIHEQCAQFGPVHHIHVDKNLGYVYLRFDSKRTCTSAHKAFHGSSFDGRLITATFMSSRLYDSMFPDFWA